jgi:nucleotide-binding universal stress UspA family protein
MLPISKILTTTDFSEPSYMGLAAAEEMARHFSAELILVHVLSSMHFVPAAGMPASTGYEVIKLTDEMAGHAKEKLRQIRTEKISESVNSRALILRGSAADLIVKTAEEEKTDVIVIATHGWTGWRRLVFGSVAERVVRQATCPVLTIPAGEEEE